MTLIVQMLESHKFTTSSIPRKGAVKIFTSLLSALIFLSIKVEQYSTMLK